jgi:alkylhydroperoxidase family enzyme
LLQDRKLVGAVLDDHTKAPWSEKEKALFDYVAAANDSKGTVDRSVVEKARAAGWSDGALYDAASVVSLFNFYNTWIDATGVHDMPAAAYAASGIRMAERGYM